MWALFGPLPIPHRLYTICNMSGANVFRTMREQIADRIRNEVLSGELPMGTNLREQALADRYGVSRAPVRDALLQLTQEGLLEAKPNCGVRVGGIDEPLQPLVIKLRQEIELFALEHAIKRLDDDDFDALDKLVEALRAACEKEDMSQVIHCDMALHRYLVEASGVSELSSVWLPIVSRMMLHYSRHGSMMESHHEHAQIVRALRKRNIKLATRLLLANIQ